LIFDWHLYQLLLFFNIEGYGEFFSGITPEQLQNLIEKIVETVIKLMPCICESQKGE
jgi:hypothetical protein